HYCGQHPYLHSFPTRRSSDLFTKKTLFQYIFLRKRQFILDVLNDIRGSCRRKCEKRHVGMQVAQCGDVEVCRTEIIAPLRDAMRSEEHTSELQSRENLVCRLL